MKSKLDMAHDWAMSIIMNSRTNLDSDNLKKIVDSSWVYADAMQAEADKRNPKPNLMAVQQNFVDGVEQPRVYHTDEWQPDWSVAPEWANYWAMDEIRACNWFKLEPYVDGDEFNYDFDGFGKSHKEAPSFNYQGDWKDSLRKRPSGVEK